MGGGTCSNESVSDFTVKEMSLHAQGAREVSPPLTSPSIGSVAVEERSSNGVIDFFSCSFVFFESWLHAGFGLRQSELVPSSRTPSAMLPRASLVAWPSGVCLCPQP